MTQGTDTRAAPALQSLAPGRREETAFVRGPAAYQFRLLFYVLLVLVVYGSTYPFDFQFSSASLSRGDQFLAHWRLVSRSGDMLGNFGLFIPVGAAGMLGLVPERSPVARFAAVLLFAFFVAAGAQVLQLFLPSRDPALGDVVWNLAGVAVGGTLVWPEAVRRRLLSFGRLGQPLVPVVLLAFWLVSELAPFVPTLDLQSYKYSLRPLLHMPSINSEVFAWVVVSWLIVLLLVSRHWPEHSRSLWLVGAAGGVVLAKVVIVKNVVDSTYLAALLLALAAWYLFLRRFEGRLQLVLAAGVALLVYLSLEPFNLRQAEAPFSWVPFSGALTGSMLINTKAISAKVFLFGSLLYLLQMHGIRSAVATALLVLLVACLEVAQIWIGNHSPEISDPLIVLVLGIALSLLLQRTDRGNLNAGTTYSGPPRAEPAVAASQPSSQTARSVARNSRGVATLHLERYHPSRESLVVALLGCLLGTLIMQLVLGLPQVPYNVKELFGGEDAWWRLFVFSLAGLSIGWGGALVGRIAERSRRPFLALPGGTIVTCLVTYLLLVASVTAESIWDITGSSNTYWFVMNRNMWGETGIWLYGAIGSKELIYAVERFVRFTALVGQMVLWISILCATYYRVITPSYGQPASAWKRGVKCALICLLSAAPWLVVFNLIAFEYSSTDNLNELIAGHGHVLYWLLVLFPTASLPVVWAAERRGARRIIVALFALLVSLPIGWLLLKHGLGATVSKYGRIFSGVDFLLGPDREDLLPEAILMVRWFVVQIVVIVGLALGIRMVPHPVEARK